MDLKQKSDVAKAAWIRKKLDIPKKDIFICVGEKCCSHLTEQEREEIWTYLKTVTRDSVEFNRFSTLCLRVCTSGPIVKVHPLGRCFHSVGKIEIDEIIKENFDKEPLKNHAINQ